MAENKKQPARDVNTPSDDARVIQAFGQFAPELDEVERHNAAAMAASNKKFTDEEIFDGATNPSKRLRSKPPNGEYRPQKSDPKNYGR